MEHGNKPGEHPQAAPAKVQFNVYLPKHLVTRIKHRAIDEDASLSALVERVLTAYIDEGARE